MSELLIDSEVRKAQAVRLIQALNAEKRWQLSVVPYVEKRSHSQNARLWLLHTAAAAVTGYSVEEMHEEALCHHFGYREEERTNPFTGEITIKRVPLKRSSQRNKKEFGEFMERTEAFYVTQLGVFLP